VKRPISIAGRQAPFCRLISTAVISKATCENGCGKLPISPFVFGLYSSAKSPASLRSPMIYKGSARGPYVRSVRAPPSNGIGLIRSFCARSIAAFTRTKFREQIVNHNRLAAHHNPGIQRIALLRKIFWRTDWGRFNPCTCRPSTLRVSPVARNLQSRA
jgi:hypothetical protein